MNRFAALHDWPALSIRAATASSTVLSRSSVPRTMNGSEPPISSTTFFRCRPAISATAVAADRRSLTAEELNRLVCHQCFRIVCVELVDRCAEGDLAPRLSYRLAHLGDDDFRKLLPPLRVQLADAPHERGPIGDSRSSR